MLRPALVCLLGTGFAVSGALFAAPNFADRIERPLRYHPVGTDFVIENGAEFFNRPLYGGNTAFRVDAGDRPEFALYLPGRGGNLRLGLRTPAGTKWLHEAAQVTTRYRPGSMHYEIRDPLLGDAALRLAALARFDREGFILRVQLEAAAAETAVSPPELVFAYGGASGQRGRRDGDIGTEGVPVSRWFQLQPEACAGNVFTLGPNAFHLRSKPAAIVGRLSADTRLATGDARQWQDLSALLASAAPGEKPAEFPVVMGTTRMRTGNPVFLSLQRDDAPAAASLVTSPAPDAAGLAALFERAEARRAELAAHVSVDTPDSFLNAAVAALNLAADSVWDEPSGTVMHGAVAWRSKLLGWRGPYVNDALGWHDRARRHLTYWAGRQNTEPIPKTLPPADASANLSRNEAGLHSNGALSHSHYDMNLVYIDAVFRHLLWTGDVALARELWPVIERHLAWERRLFRRPFGEAGELPLYEGYACIWASDDVAYNGGGATHATAYNFWHNRMAARIAPLAGADPAPHTREAELIQQAMHRELWLSDRGWYAEWRDLLGLKLAHPSPALWTFYHTVDSEAASPFEAWQMTRFIDTQLAHLPLRGRGVPPGHHTLPTTNWMPYAWSTNNVVVSEVAHTALGYWQSGRGAEAWRLFKGNLLDTMFMGLCPGNAGMSTTFDMARDESQRDFADSAGMLARATIEGLFGLAPDALAGELRVRPGFPAEWTHAALHHPTVDVAFQRTADGPVALRGSAGIPPLPRQATLRLTDHYTITPKFSRPQTVRLQLAAPRDRVESVTVNGQPAPWRVLEDAVETPRVEILSPAAGRHEIAVTWSGAAPAAAPAPAIAVLGREFRAAFGQARVIALADPQVVFTNLRHDERSLAGTAMGTPGHRTTFAQVQQGDLRWWAPVAAELRPALELIPDENQTADSLRFRVRDHIAASEQAFTLPTTDRLPGTQRLTVPHAGGRSAEGAVTNWRITAPADTRWEPVDLSKVFNARVTDIFQNEYLSPRSPYVSLALPKQGIGSWCHPKHMADIDDSGLRAAAGANGGRLVLPQGIPFATPGPGDGRNVTFTSQWDNYPRDVTVPLAGRARQIYLLLAGTTHSMMSRFDNGEVIVTYADGATERLALHNPTTWWPLTEDYRIDDYAFRRAEPLPPRIDLQTGFVRTLDLAGFKGRGGKVPGGAATVLDLPLREKELRSLKLRTLANEVVIGLMAATLAR
ncbi:MAG TPA: DUF4450 domain-containing protein [Opitutaceae bacterium]